MSGIAFKKVLTVLAGIVLAVVVLETGLRVAGTGRRVLKRASVRPPGAGDRPYVIMCIGESTTDSQYPGALQDLADEAFGRGRVRVVDEGVGATNTEVIAAQLGAKLDRHRPDMVVAMMGINDRGDIVPWDPGIRFKGLAWLRSWRLFLLLKKHIAARFAPDGPPPPPRVWREGDPLPRSPLREEAFRVASRLDVSHDGTSRLGLSGIRRFFREKIGEHPGNPYLRRELAKCHLRREDFDEGERILSSLEGVIPDDEETFLLQALLRRGKGDLPAAEAALRRGIRLFPGYVTLRRELVYVLLEQGKTATAREEFLRLTALDDNDEYVTLARCVGARDTAAGYAAEREGRAMRYRNRRTAVNYRRIVDEVRARGIRMVAMQYPLRSVLPLKALLSGCPDVLFVSNERTFRDVLRSVGYRGVFVDHFAGDFGHCTDRGNRMIAENVLREVRDVIRTGLSRRVGRAGGAGAGLDR